MYKYNNFLKTQIYYINFYYDYKNKEQILLNQSKNIFLLSVLHRLERLQNFIIFFVLL